MSLWPSARLNSSLCQHRHDALIRCDVGDKGWYWKPGGKITGALPLKTLIVVAWKKNRRWHNVWELWSDSTKSVSRSFLTSLKSAFHETISPMYLRLMEGLVFSLRSLWIARVSPAKFLHMAQETLDQLYTLKAFLELFRCGWCAKFLSARQQLEAIKIFLHLWRCCNCRSKSGVLWASEAQQCFLPDEWKTMQPYGWQYKLLLLYFDVPSEALKNPEMCALF